MKHYLDTSAVLAWLLENRDVLRPLEGETDVASSRLLWTEASRVIHRGLQTGRFDPQLATEVRHNFHRLAAGLTQLKLTDTVLTRAEGPYPLPVRPLDALHLATAEVWLDNGTPGGLSVWSLDEQMNHCAAQLGFETPLLEESASV